jgi:hypothetical protein
LNERFDCKSAIVVFLFERTAKMHWYEWYFTAVKRSSEEAARKSRITHEREVKQTPHEQLLTFLKKREISSDQPIRNIITELSLQLNDEIGAEFRRQWEEWLRVLYKHNRELIEEQDRFEPLSFEKFTDRLDFENVLRNKLASNLPPSVHAREEFPMLSNEAPLRSELKSKKRPRQQTTSDVSSDDVLEYINVLDKKAKLAVLRRELNYWMEHNFNPAVARMLQLLDKARQQITLAAVVVDANTRPTASALAKKVTDTKAQWTQSFEENKDEEGARDAILQLEGEANKWTAEHSKLWNSPDATAYLKDYESYFVGHALKNAIAAATAAIGGVVEQLHDSKIERIIVEQEATSFATQKRRRVVSSDETNDIVNVQGRLSRMHQQLQQALEKAEAQTPNESSFKAKQALAHESAVALDFADWVKVVVKESKLDSGRLLQVAETTKQATTNVDRLLQHEKQRRESAASSVQTQKQIGVDRMTATESVIKDMKTWYESLKSSLQRHYERVVQDELLIPKPWMQLAMLEVDERLLVEQLPRDKADTAQLSTASKDAVVLVEEVASKDASIASRSFQELESKLLELMQGLHVLELLKQ